MISARLRRDTITLYTYKGLDVDKKPSYDRLVIRGVFFEKDYALVMERRGVTTRDSAQVVIDLVATPVVVTMTPNSFFVSGECTDEVPPKTKQELAVERQVYTISRSYFPPNGRASATILELYAR